MNIKKNILPIKFVKRTKQAWKEIQEGKFKRLSIQDFLKEIRNLK